MSSLPPSSFPAGPVTRVGDSSGYDGWPTVEPPAPPPSDRPRLGLMWWFGGAAGLILVAGMVVVLVLLTTGQLGSGKGLFGGNDAPPDVRPPLARLCPPPSQFADPTPHTQPVLPDPTGPRTVDEKAGISYPRYDDPWLTWSDVWTGGTLRVPYGVGQFFVTEQLGNGDQYLASILSAAVPATVNDGIVIDIECTGRQVAADVRAEYYPQPNTMELMRDERTTLGGLPAWVTEFRLHFSEPGLVAKDELVGVAVLDVGKPTAAVLYVSIPGTHRQWDHVVEEVLAGVRPA